MEPMAKTDTKKTEIGLEPNVAAMLCWLPIFGWLVAIIMLLVEKKDKFVRFHALESLLTAVALYILSWIFTFMTFGLGGLIFPAIVFVVQVYGAVKAYQGEKWKLPIIGDMAQEWSGK